MTVTAIALKVCASALKVFPQFNASIDMGKEEIIYKQYISIGVAVDTDRGFLRAAIPAFGSGIGACGEICPGPSEGFNAEDPEFTRSSRRSSCFWICISLRFVLCALCVNAVASIGMAQLVN